MKVQVQLFATLARYAPVGCPPDAIDMEVPAGATVADVLSSLAIPQDLECLMLVGGRDADLGQVLRDGASLSLFPPLAGGG